MVNTEQMFAEWVTRVIYKFSFLDVGYHIAILETW